MKKEIFDNACDQMAAMTLEELNQILRPVFAQGKPAWNVSWLTNETEMVNIAFEIACHAKNYGNWDRLITAINEKENTEL